MGHALSDSLLPLRQLRRTSRPKGRSFVLTGLLLVLAMPMAVAAIWLLNTTSISDLGAGNHLAESGLQARWAQGQVIVLIRHGERCDRSAHPCLAGADGITVEGSHNALAVGSGLRRLGLDNARIIASPLTRTRQTGDFISGTAVSTEGWVQQCTDDFKDAVLAHKRAHENLVLITHSGCIDHFARQFDVRAGARGSDYTQAFFVEDDGVNPPHILGALGAQQWGIVSAGQGTR